MDKKAMYKLSYGLFVLTAQKDGKDNKDHIEIRKRIASYDLFDCPGSGIYRDIDKSAPFAFPDLFAGEPVCRIHVNIRNIDSLAFRQILLPCFFLFSFYAHNLIRPVPAFRDICMSV